jgi:hypothetical protein
MAVHRSHVAAVLAKDGVDVVDAHRHFVDAPPKQLCVEHACNGGLVRSQLDPTERTGTV